jgi:hypothetical protein
VLTLHLLLLLLLLLVVHLDPSFMQARAVLRCPMLTSLAVTSLTV